MILLLETATDICSIGISRGRELLGLVEIGDRADHAARINELILRVCAQAGCKLTDLDAVAISQGPGSYTSLRVGLATAKGICFALNKPLIAVDTLTAIAKASRQEENDKFLYCPMIDARRMEVYTAFFDATFQRLKAPHPLIVDEETFAAYLEDGYQPVIAGNGAEKCRTVLPASIRYVEVRCSAGHLVEEAFNRFLKGQFEDLAYFEPTYLKPPNVTKSKRRL